jgi:hypothetical protein
VENRRDLPRTARTVIQNAVSAVPQVREA